MNLPDSTEERHRCGRHRFSPSLNPTVTLIVSSSSSIAYITRSSATAEIVRDADDVDFVDDVHSALTLARLSQTDDTAKPWNGHSRSLKVIRRCANRRGIYDFLLALNSNLTSIFNRSWDISIGLRTPPLFQVELEKRQLVDNRHALVSGCPEQWVIQPTIH